MNSLKHFQSKECRVEEEIINMSNFRTGDLKNLFEDNSERMLFCKITISRIFSKIIKSLCIDRSCIFNPIKRETLFIDGLGPHEIL